MKQLHISKYFKILKKQKISYFLIFCFIFAGHIYSQINQIEQKFTLNTFSKSIDTLFYKVLAMNRDNIKKYNIPTNLLQKKCGLPLMFKIKKNWEYFSLSQKSTINSILQRPNSDTSIISSKGNFRIHYSFFGFNAPPQIDNDKNNVPDFIDSVAYYFEYCLEKETKELGFLGLRLNSNTLKKEYDVYIKDLGRGEYGYTTLEERIPFNQVADLYSTFITIDNDFVDYYSSGMDGLKVTAAHELFHSIQIENYGTWLDDVYFYEFLSTWMEQMVFPEIKDYYQYIKDYYNNTDLPFYQHDGYDLALWPIFLTLKYSYPIIKDFLLGIIAERPLPAMENVFIKRGTSFGIEYSELSLWNYFTSNRSKNGKYFPEAKNYPLLSGSSIVSTNFIPPKSNINNQTQSLTTNYYQILNENDSITIILTNTDIENAIQSPDKYFNYTYEINNTSLNNSYFKIKNGLNILFNSDKMQNWNNLFLLNNDFIRTQSAVKVFPNPFVSNLNSKLSFVLPFSNENSAYLSIYSNDMRLIYSSNISAYKKYDLDYFEWNGIDDSGNRTSSGVYFYSLTSGSNNYFGKIVIIKK